MDARPLSDHDLEAIEARAAAATRGPWHNATEAIRRRHADRGRNGWRAKKGHRLRDTAVYAVVGAPTRADPALLARNIDADGFAPGSSEYDYRNVLILYWWAVRGTTHTNGPSGEDLTFIAHARTDVPALVAEVRRLRALLADHAQGVQG